MPSSIADYLPSDAGVVLQLGTHEVARYLLGYLRAVEEGAVGQGRYDMRAPTAINKVKSHYAGQAGDDARDVVKRFMEAWSWLESAGLIAPDHSESVYGHYFLTERGRSVRCEADFAVVVRARLLPQNLLHAKLSGAVWSAFVRAEYDAAVFQAYKAVETAVRNAGGYAPSDIGPELMRKAFAPAKGLLSDKNALPAEQEALAHLFAGAMGYFRNPFAHRSIVITDPNEAAEMIVLAGHLLRIVDARSPRRAGSESLGTP